jgi:hypothetical protein
VAGLFGGDEELMLRQLISIEMKLVDEERWIVMRL